ncbi:hypothetical protein M8542_25830 [Amycolatopsis sp. OK19-0408]|uniref:Uncharacterized protein n=1 Tax=Amycolatopsis iheyensis TaxID=2945988 RepID=A0A9X2NED3_9PSEU|nr:hypothetical protein [Amycolatopsis iheyensis]MCR6486252.1 hypothetical protein [Amycolatopsis iheyensis]
MARALAPPPTEAVRGLRELMGACDEILAVGGSPDAAVAALVPSMDLTASWTWKL